MGKRVHEEDEPDCERPLKRTRPSSVDRLWRLSDELVLRILSHLPVLDLAVCQRYVVSFNSFRTSTRSHTELSDFLTSITSLLETANFGEGCITTALLGPEQVEYRR